MLKPARLSPPLAALLLVVQGGGCAHAPPASQPARPAGDTLLRCKGSAGDTVDGRGRLVIESDLVGGQKGGSHHVQLTFDFGGTEKILALASDGTASVSAQLSDVIGRVGPGGNQAAVDQFALVLDEVKITFSRTPRCETSALVLKGVRPPLDEQSARAMLNALFSAQRGPLFPEDATQAGGTWKSETVLPASTGFAGLVSYAYALDRKEGKVAVITGTGKIDGTGGSARLPRHMRGQSQSTYDFDIVNGRFAKSVVDATVQVEQTTGADDSPEPPPAVEIKQHVHAEWTPNPLPATTAR
jgi:hypothetical protein